MNKKYSLLKIVFVYLIFISCILFSSVAFGQVNVVHFNADWNSQNNVEWFNKLDVDKKTMNIEDGDCQKKYNIAIVPTIVVFSDGEEVKRYQADLSFKMVATKNEIQEYIDDLIMSQF